MAQSGNGQLPRTLPPMHPIVKGGAMTEQRSKFNRSAEPVEACLKGQLTAVKRPSTVAAALRLLLRAAVLPADGAVA